MILNQEKRKVLKSCPLQTYSVNVKSPTVLFSILCDKTYQFPLQTLVQEYMSNARDSHREIGKDDVPIEVIFPNKLDPRLTIRDFGSGISPERMETVFVWLGESTKRVNNEQNGGFGIGAKIGYAYNTKSFTVTSYHDNITREYTAYIGEDNLGHIDLIDEYDSHHDQKNGVEISIPVKDSDFNAVQKAAIRCSLFWDTRPIFHNISNYYNIFDVMTIDFPDSKMISIPKDVSNFIFDKILSTSPGILLVYDKIIYGILPEMEEIYSKGVITNSAICVDVGEVDIAINREGLQYTPKTINMINSLIADNIKKSIITAKTEFLHNLDDDISIISDKLSKKGSSVITESFIEINWGNLELVYYPGSDHTLYVKIPYGYDIYKASYNIIHHVSKSNIYKSNNIFRYCKTYARKRRNRLLPLSSAYTYLFDNRDTNFPSPVMTSRWVNSVSDNNCFFIIKPSKHHRQDNNWVENLRKELSIPLISKFIKPRKEKNESELKNSGKTNYNLYNPYNYPHVHDTGVVFEWLNESDKNTVILVKKTNKTNALSVYNSFNRKCDLLKEAMGENTLNNTRLYLISNKTWLDKLCSEHKQIITYEKWKERFDAINRNIGYQNFIDAVSIIHKMDDILYRLELDQPGIFETTDDYFWRTSEHKIKSDDYIFTSLIPFVDKIKDPIFKKIIKFTELHTKFNELMNNVCITNKRSDKHIVNNLPYLWNLKNDDFNLFWKVTSRYPLIKLVSRTYYNNIKEVAEDIALNYLNNRRIYE